MLGVCTIWQETYGNGATTGMSMIITSIARHPIPMALLLLQYYLA